jgi:hypothetical protein
VVREVADHREDLIQAAMADGLPALHAAVRADAALGSPDMLAEDLMVSIRRSSRCGRHPFVAFALLPLLTFPLFWALMMSLNLCLGFALGFGWDTKRLHSAADNPASFHHMLAVFQVADYVAIALVALLFCVLAIRSAVDQAWVLVAGIVCTVYAMFIFATLEPHQFSTGISSTPQWFHASVPLVTIGIVHLCRRWQLRKALKLAAL